MEGIKRNSRLFSKPNLRVARRELLAGKNQLLAIRNWLIASQLVEKDGSDYRLTRFGERVLENDSDFRKSASWWAFHLLVCTCQDAFPYDTLFLILDTNVRQFVSNSSLREEMSKRGNSAEGSIKTYFDGVASMFMEDGPLQGLGLIEVKKGGGGEIGWRIGTPAVPESVVVFAMALAKERYFSGRPSVDFGELLEKGIDRFLTLSQDDLRRRLNVISNSTQWRDEIRFNDVANLASITFGDRFTVERMLLALIQGGEDSWI